MLQATSFTNTKSRYSINVTSLENVNSLNLYKIYLETDYLLLNHFEQILLSKTMAKYEHKKPKKNYTFIENLNTILDQFEKNKCLVVVNNFQGVQIYPIKRTPIILRQIGLALLSIYPKNKWDGQTVNTELVWAPHGTYYNVSSSIKVPADDLKVKTRHPCPTSTIFTPTLFGSYTGLNHGFCVGIDLDLFIRASKLWQCQIQVDLFRPEFLFEIGKPVQIFRSIENEYSKFLPSTVPQINMLVHSYPLKYKSSRLHHWVTVPGNDIEKDVSSFYIRTDTQLTALATCISKSFWMSCYIENLNVLKPCVQCSNHVDIIPLNLKLLSVSYIVKKGVSKRQGADVIMFMTYSAAFLAKVKDFSMKKIKSSENYKLGQVLGATNLRKLTSDSDNALAMMYAMFIIDRLGNVTGPDFSKTDSTANWMVWLDSTKNPNKVLQFTNVLSPMSFITCNTKGISLFPFSEFWSVFSKNVWTLLCVSIVTLIFTFKLVSAKHFLEVQSWQPKELLCMLKVLVEQGDPFPNSLLQPIKFRFIVSGLLLAGIVLSNCYKSNNVYNMIRQRDLVPYNQVDEILNDNFTIFSRVMYLNYYLRNYLDDWLKNSVNLRSKPYPFQVYIHAFIGKDGNWQDIYGDTEAKIYHEQIYAPIEENSGNKQIIKTLTSAIPHPKVFELVVDPIQALATLNRVGIIPKRILSKTSESFWGEIFRTNF